MALHLNPKRLRTVRWVSAVGFVVATLLFYGTINREVGWHFGSDNFIALGDACLKIGTQTDKFGGPNPAAPGPYLINTWHTDWAVAWRPFHARDLYSRGPADWHLVVLPILPLVPLCALLAGWAHGRLAGLRAARTLSCVSCGYDLSRTPMVNERRTCPECGVAAGPAAAVATGVGGA
jgi:hypothetical protein